MYAVLKPDGTLYELRDGTIDATTNTQNRQKRYAVLYEAVRPALGLGEQHVLTSRDVIADKVTDVFIAVLIPPQAITLEQKVEALMNALITKGTITRAEIDTSMAMEIV